MSSYFVEAKHDCKFGAESDTLGGVYMATSRRQNSELTEPPVLTHIDPKLRLVE